MRGLTREEYGYLRDAAADGERELDDEEWDRKNEVADLLEQRGLVVVTRFYTDIPGDEEHEWRHLHVDATPLGRLALSLGLVLLDGR